MRDYVNNKVYNTETATPVKYCVDVEELGDGWIRYSTKVVYYKDNEDEYFLYVKRVTTSNKWCDLFDVQEYIVPVTKDWVKVFNRHTEDIWPNSSFKGRPRETRVY